MTDGTRARLPSNRDDGEGVFFFFGQFMTAYQPTDPQRCWDGGWASGGAVPCMTWTDFRATAGTAGLEEKALEAKGEGKIN